MQHSLNNISRPQAQFSEEQPIIGMYKRHLKPRGPLWDMHYGLEMGVIISGMERRIYPDKFEMNAGPGSIWFCGMWEPHGAMVVKAPCEMILLWIWPPFLAQMRFPEEPGFNALAPFNAPPRQRPQTTVKQKKQMLCYGRQMKDILRSRTPYYKIKLRVVVLEMLIQICESWREAAKWGRRAPSKEFSQINRAVQMVFNSRSFISTIDAARACGLDRHVFSSLFKSWMNISFAEFSMKHRLHQAAMQVRDTLEPIKSIALHWGFVDESHFYRVFMRHFGMSPYEYRKRMFSAHCPDG